MMTLTESRTANEYIAVGGIDGNAFDFPETPGHFGFGECADEDAAGGELVERRVFFAFNTGEDETSP